LELVSRIAKSVFKFAFTNLWCLWLIFTYIFITTAHGAEEISNTFSYLINPLVGLFVPISQFTIQSLLGFSSDGNISYAFSEAIIIIPLLILIILFLGNLLSKQLPKNFIRAFFNIIVLFSLTLSVELVVWHGWLAMSKYISHTSNWVVRATSTL